METDLHLAPPEQAETTGKEGRVLSQANIAKLRDGFTAIQGVLESAGVEQPEVEAAVASAKALAAKCGCEMVEDWHPYGGATSFAAADAYDASQKKTYAINDLQYEFQAIVENIWADETMTVERKAAAVATAASDLESRITRAANKSIVGRVINAFKGKVTEKIERTWDDVEPTADDEKAASLPVPMSVFKDATGQYRYVAVATNSYRDKEGETFSPAAHKDYVDWVDRTKEYPELWLWHTPGTRIGKADQIYFDEDTGFRVSTGTFDKGMEEVAERLSTMPDIAMSHGYLFRKDHLVDGVYHRYRDFEETLLPSVDVAASDATAFVATREDPMTAPAAKREWFEKVLGKPLFDKIEASLGERAAAMSDEEFATAFKAVMAEETSAPATPAAPASTPVAAATDPSEDGTLPASMKSIVTEGMKEALAPIASSLKDLTDWRTAIDVKIAALERSEDEKVAAMFGARAIAPVTIVAPADDPENVVDGRAMKALKAALGGDKDEKVASPVAGMVEMLMTSLGQPASI